MKKYLYFWIENYKKLNDGSSYLFEDFGINLSSHYNICHNWDSSKLEIEIEEKSDVPECFYSDNIVDLKVFVGDNGCGKTTLLTALFQLVAKGIGEPPSEMGHYALVYTEGGNFFLRTNLSQDNCDLIKDSQKVNVENGSHISNYAIYYSATFDDQEYRIDQIPISGDLHGSCNISTNALLINDEETLKNNSLSIENYPNQLDALHCYYCMEQLRRVSFLCDFIEVEGFWSDFNLPKKIELKVIKENVKNAFYELLYLQKNELSVVEFISVNCLEKTKWEKISNYPDSGVLVDLEKDVLNGYMVFYNNLSLMDQIRFAALMDLFRTWKDRSVFDLSTFSLKVIKECLIDDRFDFNQFYKLNKFNDLENINDNYILDNAEYIAFLISFNELKESVESLLGIIDGSVDGLGTGFASTENGCIRNNAIYFDLNNHTQQFIKVVSIYNHIVKDVLTSPFLSFGFSRALSAGESSMIKLYSRLYDAVKNLEHEEIHFFLDEVDLYLHPEWQRQWLQRFIDGLKYISEALGINLKFQVFLSTHSPFMLTDFLTDSLLLLRREDCNHGTHIELYENEESSNNIFCANVYDLVGSGFFLKNTIGYFAENKIKKLIENCSIEDDGEKKGKLILLNKVGDPVLNILISKTLNGCKKR